MYLVGWDKEVIDIVETFINLGCKRDFETVHHINLRLGDAKKDINLSVRIDRCRL